MKNTMKNYFLGFKLREDWEYDPRISKYVDRYRDGNDKDSFYDELDYHNFYSAVKDEVDNLNGDLFYLQVGIDKEGEDSDYLDIKIYGKELDYPFEGFYPADILNPAFKDEYMTDEEQSTEYPELYNKIIEEINYINTELEEILTSYGMAKVRDGYRIKPLSKNSISEDIHNGEKVELEYPDLEIYVTYGPKDWDTGVGTEEFDGEIEYTYPVDKQDVEEFLAEFIYGKGEEEFDELVDSDDYDGYYNYIRTNFDRLFDKYYWDILDNFRDKATEHAIEHMDFDEYQ